MCSNNPNCEVGLDHSVLTNYRSISNLSTISKFLERLFLSRLKPQVLSLCFSLLQSVYRSHHSNETELIRIVNDMFEAADSSCATVLVALDLSAAFDTIDHHVLLNRLLVTFGVTGKALNWIKSCLIARTSFVKIGSFRHLRSHWTPAFHKDLFWDLCCSLYLPLHLVKSFLGLDFVFISTLTTLKFL